MKKRTRYDIVAEILEALRCLGPCSITKVSYRVGAPVDRVRSILKQMVKSGFVIEKEFRGKRAYIITKLGYDYLSAYRKLKAFMELLDSTE